MRFFWEQIFKITESDIGIRTYRCKVPGGWLVKDTWWIEDKNGNESNTQSMIFFPDPENDWEITG